MIVKQITDAFPDDSIGVKVNTVTSVIPDGLVHYAPAIIMMLVGYVHVILFRRLQS